MKQKIFICLICTFVLTFTFNTNSISEEGMWPISEIHKLNLKAKGLKIDLKDIYNPDGISLVDGIVNVGGCTGSFVSSEGLILTNHHCAYRAIQAASTVEHDYLANGFYAKNKSEEIPANGYTVRITESYKDVSKEVLKAVKSNMDLAERTKAIEKKMKEIVAKAEKKHKGKRADVSEMFIGKTYVLFIFTYIKDVRLVYAPPRSIGNFGGEVDNWVWPRHTGDFSFMRAYVAKDGSPADFSRDNVPYKPKKHLRVESKGVNEEDFVFILGYPGRTYRHRTSHYLAYEEKVRMPYVADYYEWQISEMEKMGENDRAIALRHLSRIKGLSNTMKNYRGKITGLNRLKLVDKKRDEEKAFQEFIVSDQKRKTEYGNLLNEISKVYEEIEANSKRELLLTYLLRSSNLMNFAYTTYEASIERAKKDINRESAYMDRNYNRTKQRLFFSLADYYEPTDKVLFKERLVRTMELPLNQKIKALNDINNSESQIDQFIKNAYLNSNLNNKEYLERLFTKSQKEAEKINDPFIKLAIKLYPVYQEQKDIDNRRKGAIDKLYAQLIDVKRDFLGADFNPDANGTLRLTFGKIRGYYPKDATYYNPITTLHGVVEKTTGQEPFDTPQKILDLFKAKDFGKFYNPKVKSVPVGILYNMDTSGGNSGSPVLNGNGDLVGVNFDRAWEATINDFAWSEDYSRSIAVDIRYVLWVTQKYAGANYLLEEMGVE